jgi:hypothetical protein
MPFSFFLILLISILAGLQLLARLSTGYAGNADLLEARAREVAVRVNSTCDLSCFFGTFDRGVYWMDDGWTTGEIGQRLKNETNPFSSLGICIGDKIVLATVSMRISFVN